MLSGVGYPRRMAQKPKTFRLLETTPARVHNSMTLSGEAEYKAKTYGRRWQKIRAMQLAREPLCRHCAQRGETTAATQVDHIVRLKRGGTHHPSNLQSLCASCHSKKTARE